MWQRFRVVSLFLLLVTTHQRAVAAAAAARQQGGTEGGGGHNQATTYTVEVPQYSAGDGRRVVELTFHPPALITGAINTSLYDAPDKNVSMLNASAIFTQNFFAVDEDHIFGQLLWYGGNFKAGDGTERKYSMYVYSSDGGRSWGKPPQTPTSAGGTVPPGWFPTIDTTVSCPTAQLHRTAIPKFPTPTTFSACW
jgi:hypothetical protein